MSNVKPGAIIVASSQLEQNPWFRRSVILILAHDTNGTLGINLAGEPLQDSVIQGGAMMNAAYVIHKTTEGVHDNSLEIGETGYSYTPFDFNDAESTVDLMRLPSGFVSLGYVGWAPMQLDDERASGAWAITPKSLAEVLDVFSEERWELASQGAVDHTIE